MRSLLRPNTLHVEASYQTADHPNRPTSPFHMHMGAKAAAGEPFFDRVTAACCLRDRHERRARKRQQTSLPSAQPMLSRAARVAASLCPARGARDEPFGLRFRIAQ